jgi:HEPN domain-containing protein
MQELTKEWVDKAESDFYSADLLLHAGEVPVPDYACFHCQQCAEKYLKAYLQEHAIEFERKHDLIPLLNLCMRLDTEFQALEEDLYNLDRYAVIVRYPGIIIKATTAEEALKSADRVQAFVRKKLKIK